MSEFKLNKRNYMHSNGDGYITRSGHTMFQQDIVRELQRGEQLEKENAELREGKDLKLLANAAKTMLELLVKAAPIEGLWLSDIEEWDEMIKEAQA